MATPRDFGPDSPASWETDADRGFKPVRMSDGSPLPLPEGGGAEKTDQAPLPKFPQEKSLAAYFIATGLAVLLAMAGFASWIWHRGNKLKTLQKT